MTEMLWNKMHWWAYRMSKNGDWEIPGKASIIPAEGRDPAIPVIELKYNSFSIMLLIIQESYNR